jgi:hypothetical protein
MYKKASQNLQSRSDRKVDPTPLDTSVFDKHWDDVTALCAEKMQIEMALTQVNKNLSTAGQRAHSLGQYMRPEMYQSLRTRRATLVDKKQKIEMRLIELRQVRQKAAHLSHRNFEYKFIAMAKIMLADDVYDRLIAATAHALHEEDPQ